MDGFPSGCGKITLCRLRNVRQDVSAAVVEDRKRQAGVQTFGVYPLFLLSGTLSVRGDHLAENGIYVIGGQS